jgi:acetylornithine/succinyldiaminopimelate/putrescine aminotransferase
LYSSALFVPVETAMGVCRSFGNSLIGSAVTRAVVDLARASSPRIPKDTHEHTIRIAPPLVITSDEVDWALEQFATTLTQDLS